MDSFPETTVNIDELGSTLRQFRRMRRVLMRDAADQVGIELTHLAAIENGRALPSFETLQALVSAYYAPVKVVVRP